MQLAYRNIDKVTLINSDRGEIVLPYITFFSISEDRIIVETEMRNTELKRGWVGDLCYETTVGVKVTGEETASTYKDCFNDVILISVNATGDPSCAVNWEYCFLKK